MNKSNFHVLVIIILSCLQATTAFNSIVPPMCRDISKSDPKHVSYEFCVSILESDPRSRTSTAPQLAQISFELGTSKSHAISSTIDKVSKLLASDATATNALKYCSSIYSGIPGELGAGFDFLKLGAFDTANARVSSAMKATITCTSEIKDMKGDAIANLRKEINDFYQLGSICLGFIKLLRIIN